MPGTGKPQRIKEGRTHALERALVSLGPGRQLDNDKEIVKVLRWRHVETWGGVGAAQDRKWNAEVSLEQSGRIHGRGRAADP